MYWGSDQWLSGQVRLRLAISSELRNVVGVRVPGKADIVVDDEVCAAGQTLRMSIAR